MLARKRRKLTTVQVAERAGIVRSTLYLIKKGNSSVAMGAYFNVLRVLGLQDDFLKLAEDDIYTRKLQDLDLLLHDMLLRGLLRQYNVTKLNFICIYFKINN